MFQGIRNSSPIYILHKTEPRLEVGEVVSVSNPLTQYGATAFPAGFGSRTVDIKVRINETVHDFKGLPAEASIADSGAGMVVSESKDAILNEIDGFSKNSERALAEVEHHRAVVEECRKMREALNPQLKKEAEQALEIESLKRGMAEIKSMIEALGHSQSKKN